MALNKVVDAKGTEWTRDSIIALLKGCSCPQCEAWQHMPGKYRPCREGVRSNIAVENALLRLYARQTPDEQNRECTEDDNQKGFGGTTAKIFTSFAKQIMENKWKNPVGLRLSIKQFARCRKPWGQTTIPTIATYAGQLLQEIAEKARIQTAKAYIADPSNTLNSLEKVERSMGARG